MRHVCRKYEIICNGTLWAKAHLVLVVHLLLLANLVGSHVQRLNEIMSLNSYALRRKYFQVVSSPHLVQCRAKSFHFRTFLHVEESQSWCLWGVKN